MFHAFTPQNFDQYAPPMDAQRLQDVLEQGIPKLGELSHFLQASGLFQISSAQLVVDLYKTQGMMFDEKQLLNLCDANKAFLAQTQSIATALKANQVMPQTSALLGEMLAKMDEVNSMLLNANLVLALEKYKLKNAIEFSVPPEEAAEQMKLKKLSVEQTAMRIRDFVMTSNHQGALLRIASKPSIVRQTP